MSPVEEAKRALKFADQGFKAYKFHSAILGHIDDSADMILKTVCEVRVAVGVLIF